MDVLLKRWKRYSTETLSPLGESRARLARNLSKMSSRKLTSRSLVFSSCTDHSNRMIALRLRLPTITKEISNRRFRTKKIQKPTTTPKRETKSRIETYSTTSRYLLAVHILTFEFETKSVNTIDYFSLSLDSEELDLITDTLLNARQSHI